MSKALTNLEFSSPPLYSDQYKSIDQSRPYTAKRHDYDNATFYASAMRVKIQLLYLGSSKYEFSISLRHVNNILNWNPTS